MLCLGRKLNEGLTIGDVHLRVVRIGSNYVRLAITAPKDTLILRDEIRDRNAGLSLYKDGQAGKDALVLEGGT